MAKFNFMVDDDKALEELARITGRAKKADVVRDSLSVYQFLVKRIQEGDRIYLGHDKEHASELLVTTLEKVPRPTSASATKSPA